MKKTVTLLSAMIMTFALQAQTTLFDEDFESTAPITSLENSFSNDMPDGPSPCSKASRGDAADFNSTNVDFNSTQNSTMYLGANPEAPCGGFYTANVVNTSTFDFSGSDSLVFSCRYFISSTLNWGSASIEITFDDGTTSEVIPASTFNVTDDWTTVEVTIPNTLYSSSSVDMIIVMGGGEGTALDDITIVNYPPTTTSSTNSLTGFTYLEGNGPSAEQSFTVSGQYLSSDVVVTAPTNYEISTTSGSGFAGSLNVTPTSGTVNQMIYVRLQSGLMATGNPYNGDITISHPGTTDINVSLEGLVTTPSGLEETVEQALRVYPNPFHDELSFEVPSTLEGADFELLTLTGQTVYSDKVTQQKMTVNLDLPNGIYFLKLQKGSVVHTQKVLKH